MELATIGGGCFWCLEAIYQLVTGVKSVTSGYAGGHKDNPMYNEVCEELTGHAEVIQIEFDPAIISFERILEIFWSIHDPTTLNRQGNDIGSQYRSIILYHNESQKEIANKTRELVAANWKNPVITEIIPLKIFYPAEAYHQNYFRNNPNNSYCVYVVKPKVEKLSKTFR